jgi:tRNA(Ile)-lysidine synthase TilS/MesJ
MAGKARSRFVARSYARTTERSDAYYRSNNEYGVDCIYCEKYFVNVKKPKFGGYICRECKSNSISL